MLLRFLGRKYKYHIITMILTRGDIIIGCTFNKLGVLAVIFVFVVVSCVVASASSEGERHVYYCYVPPSSNLPELIELRDGKQYNYTPPPGTALLDVVAIHDNTKIVI